ncbi:hypothetical protein ncot_16205 [Nocardioides sp. JQ2195]|uniref:hypothetical protein n=1 Tax=Nocardioides sp. JQ2195 TaxID=2592334 RepID=UPI00143E6167|nr:hypothetical protein [Nocardioides sp. JQ2195]QIX27959.1 hypothetical protein ncot_16205 [Nocardioides sp. JQ2195]
MRFAGGSVFGGALLCALTISPTLGPISGPASAAAGDNCTNQGNYFAGVGSPQSSTIFGSRAMIERDAPQLCSSQGGSPSDSSAWAMVTADIMNDTSGALHYAQIGWARVGDDAGEPVSGLHLFAQYTRKCAPACDGSSFVNVYGPDPGSTARMYSNVLRSSDNHIHMLYDGIQLLETGYNPQGDWNADWQAQFAAETFHPQTDVAGTTGDKNEFWNLQRMDSGGGFNFVQNFPLQVESTSRYHLDLYDAQVGGKGMKTWTAPL